MEPIKTAEDMILAGVEGADPEELTKRCVKREKEILTICGKDYSMKEHEEVLLFGIGKASPWTAEGLKDLPFDDGLLITNEKEAGTLPDIPFTVIQASHPYPSEKNIDATDRLLSRLEKSEDPLVIFLISGGGSSLFTHPLDGITLEDLRHLNELLIHSGADIKELNTVRKHVSQVKGGRFGKRAAEKGTIVSLVISDVVGDELTSIASGPTCPDPTSFQDAVNVLKRYDLWNRAPEGIRDHLDKGLKGKIDETATNIDCDNHLIGNNLTALEAAEKEAEKRGYQAMILTSQNTGEARDVCRPYCAMTREIQDSGHPIGPPAALIFGGEMTVSFGPDVPSCPSKEGGPNREFVLGAAIDLKDRDNIVVASADTDGKDGFGKAGAVISTAALKEAALDPKPYLKEHNTQAFFDQLDASLEFDSRTNVNDITVILIEEDEN